MQVFFAIIANPGFSITRKRSVLAGFFQCLTTGARKLMRIILDYLSAVYKTERGYLKIYQENKEC